MTLELKQERQAFEDFMRSQNNGDRLELDADGSYADISIEYAWSGWIGRASKEAERNNWLSVAHNPPPMGVWLLGKDKLGQVGYTSLFSMGALRSCIGMTEHGIYGKKIPWFIGSCCRSHERKHHGKT